MSKEHLMELWKKAFGDTDSFVKLFFDKVYKEENTLTIEKGEEVISALYMVPYVFSFYGKEIPVCYICGVTTIPAEQGKGHMRNLLQRAFQLMEQRGFILSALIPAENWLFDYYRGLGYREFFDYKLVNFLSSSKKTSSRSYSSFSGKEMDMEKLYAYFNKKLRQLPAVILHSFSDFQVILEDLYLSEGELFVACNAKGVIKGVAFCYRDKIDGEDSLLIKELLTDNEAVKKYLLTVASSHFGCNKIRYRQPGTGTNRIRYGMIKIIDKVQLINRWMAAQPGKKELFPTLEKMEETALLYTLFNYSDAPPYMNLMLD